MWEGEEGDVGILGLDLGDVENGEGSVLFWQREDCLTI